MTQRPRGLRRNFARNLRSLGGNGLVRGARESAMREEVSVLPIYAPRGVRGGGQAPSAGSCVGVLSHGNR